MPWSGAAGQNIEHPHTLVILSSFFKCVLVLLARCNSDELRCPMTTLIVFSVTVFVYVCVCVYVNFFPSKISQELLHLGF